MSYKLYKKAFLFALAAENAQILSQIKQLADLFVQTYSASIKALENITNTELHKSNKNLQSLYSRLANGQPFIDGLYSPDITYLNNSLDKLTTSLQSAMFFTLESNKGSGFEAATKLKVGTYYSPAELVSQCYSILERIKKLTPSLKKEEVEFLGSS